MGLIGLVIMFAPASGPSISGLILANLSWHWIFWISAPFFLISLVCGLLFLPNISKLTKPKIDVLSIVLSTLGFGGIVYGFSGAGGHGESGGGWTSPIVIATLVIGIVALLLFSIRQLRMKQPVMDLRAFKYPMFTIGLFARLYLYDDDSILHAHSAYVSAQGMAVTALTAGLVLFAGKPAQWIFVSSHGPIIRQVWTEVARDHRNGGRSSCAVPIHRHRSDDTSDPDYYASCLHDDRNFNGDDACTDERIESTAA